MTARALASTRAAAEGTRGLETAKPRCAPLSLSNTTTARSTPAPASPSKGGKGEGTGDPIIKKGATSQANARTKGANHTHSTLTSNTATRTATALRAPQALTLGDRRHRSGPHSNRSAPPAEQSRHHHHSHKTPLGRLKKRARDRGGEKSGEDACSSRRREHDPTTTARPPTRARTSLELYHTTSGPLQPSTRGVRRV